MHYLRTWDSQASSRVDHYIANSGAVARRINKFYRRDCETIFPPVDTTRFSIAPKVEDYYIVVSRFVPYKRLDLAVQAFTKLGLPLKVVGTGRQLKQLKEMAGPTIEFLGRVDDVALPGLMAAAKAFIMPGEEDFGIAPVEANACGRPVIAFGAGGALDSQIDGVTGVFFPEPTVDSLCDAVRRFEKISFDTHRIRAHAETFDTDVFRARIQRTIEQAIRLKDGEKVVAKTIEDRPGDRRLGDRRQSDRRQREQLDKIPFSNDRRVGSRRTGERREGDRRQASMATRTVEAAGFFKDHVARLQDHDVERLLEPQSEKKQNGSYNGSYNGAHNGTHNGTHNGVVSRP